MNAEPLSKPASLIAAATMLLASYAISSEIDPSVQTVQHCCDQACGCCDVCCDSDCCRKVCVATVEKVKVEKHCWKTEAKDICVPKVVLPWQEGGSGLSLFSCLKKSNGCRGCGDTCCGDACCADACCGGGCCMKPRCGKVITVCDLKKEKYECEERVCKWEIRRLPPCGESPCCGDACCSSICDPSRSATLRWEPEIQLTAAIAGDSGAAADEPIASRTEADSASKLSWLERLMIWK